MELGSRSEDSLDIDIHTRHGWTVGHQLQDALAEHGLETQFVGFANDATHTAITIAGVFGAAGGVRGLATALKAYFDRNRHRSVSVRVKGKEINVAGYSLKQTMELLQAVKDMPNDEG